MGKRQHQKDKLYVTCREWSTLYGGRAANQQNVHQFCRIRYYQCALTLQPFVNPYCTYNGVIYDLANVVPFVQKYGVDPYTGDKLEIKSLIKLNFYKNSSGHYQCPVLYKDFTENSHIVAIKTTGNVFSYEAIEQLNIKAKHFKDLLTDEPFERKDIITILDPNNLEKFNTYNFHYVKNQLSIADEDAIDKNNANNLRIMNNETRATLKELSEVEERLAKSNANNEPKAEKVKAKADALNAAHYSTGELAASFTSTAIDRTINSLEPAILEMDVIKYRRVKKKGYVRFETTLGSLNLELYCDQTPKTCDNFIRLCKQDYYNKTKFHRLIKNFMIQGGDPTGTGSGGQSAFGEPFDDEIRPQYSHEGRGILSMANSGPNTNKSQFFITLRSCKHLDKKHTIFGKLVGGMTTLDKMEQIKTNDKDKPLEDITILSAVVFVDPFQEIEDEIVKERERLNNEKSLADNKKKIDDNQKKVIRNGIGSYINLDSYNGNSISSQQQKKQKIQSSSFGNFNGW